MAHVDEALVTSKIVTNAAIPIAYAAILALSSFVLSSSSRISVLEIRADNQDHAISNNSITLKELNANIAKLNITLSVLNERLEQSRTNLNNHND